MFSKQHCPFLKTVNGNQGEIRVSPQIALKIVYKEWEKAFAGKEGIKHVLHGRLFFHKKERSLLINLLGKSFCDHNGRYNAGDERAGG